jgi:hypothetical protein
MLLLKGLNNATSSPFIAIRRVNGNYDPTATNNAFGSNDLGQITDVAILGSSGFNMTTDFERAKLISFSVEFSVTGVSALNKKGNLYLADEWTGDAGFLNANNAGGVGTAADYNAATALVNVYPISTLIKIPHITKQLTTDENIQMTWKWTPSVDHAFSNFQQPFQNTTTQNLGPQDGTDNAFVFVAQGCDASTIVNYEVHAIFASDVDAGLTNTYPRAVSNSYSYTYQSVLSKMNSSGAKFSSGHEMEIIGKQTPNYMNTFVNDKGFMIAGSRAITY